MRCLVPVKRVIDPNVKVRVKNDGKAVDTDHVKMSMNPFDEIAIEEAVRQKEAGKISEIVAVSIGGIECQEILREALARGADAAFLIDSASSFSSFSGPSELPILEPIHVAKILKLMVLREKVELVILGKQAIDDDANQTGQMLAGLLGWGQGTFASKLEISEDNATNKNILVTREIDSGLESIKLKLPAVVTTDLRLNEPRYIALPNLMKAKTKPLTVLNLKNDLQFEDKPRTKILNLETPVVKRTTVFVSSVKELVEKLKNEAKVIE